MNQALHIFDTEIAPTATKLSQQAYRLTGNRHDAEDLVQETLQRAWLGVKKGQYTAGTNPLNWTHRIMLNKYIEDQRVIKNKMTDVGLPDDYEAMETTPSAEDESDWGSINHELVDAINGLDSDLRDTIYLFYIKSLSVKQVANMTNVPEGTVMSRLHRARGLLRDAIAVETSLD